MHIFHILRGYRPLQPTRQRRESLELDAVLDAELVAHQWEDVPREGDGEVYIINGSGGYDEEDENWDGTYQAPYRKTILCAAALSLLLIIGLVVGVMVVVLVRQSGHLTGPLLRLSAPSTPAAFRRPNASAHIDCGRVMAGDTDYIATLTSRRVTHTDAGEGELAMDCESIRARHFFPSRPLSAAEARWPWAQARVVFRDYEMLEAELASAYAPQNWYCYAVDAKADPVFRQRVHALAECLPNVVVAAEEVEVDSHGHGMIPSMLNCVEALLSGGRKWEYVSMLQNHDVQLKTNAEVVRILQWLDGANDVSSGNTAGLVAQRLPDPNMDWSFAALKIFREQARNEQISSNGYPPQLVFSKGWVECTLSKRMAEFLLNTLDLTILLDRLEAIAFDADELYFATLNAADALEAPGRFTRSCIEREQGAAPSLSRVSMWSWDGTWKCKSGLWRNNICILGMEDLQWLSDVPELYANKMWPELDSAALVCLHEWRFNRTHLARNNGGDKMGISGGKLNETFYKSLPQVRFQEFRRQRGTVAREVLEQEFQCNT